MKKFAICLLVSLTICFNLFSQTSINETMLDNFYEYRNEITEYFMYYFREEYPGAILYYNSQLMTRCGNIINMKMISDEIIDLIIGLYNRTLSLEFPEEDKEIYIEAGLGENGHELYINILSIMYFMSLEENINIFPQDEQKSAKNNIIKLKKLFSQQDWDITVNFFKKKRNE